MLPSGRMAGPHGAHPKASEEFGRLLSGAINSIATYEGKTAPMVESELGQQIGLTVASIQRYKSGRIPPEPRTVRIFAEAGVKRGFLNRRWLARFLHAASYPSPDGLIDELCPATLTDRPAGRVLHNLPAPSYAQFVMREQPFAEIIEALRQRTAVVVLSSLGGMGKTSLAREVAARCLVGDGPPGLTPQGNGLPGNGLPGNGLPGNRLQTGPPDALTFDGAVWVSDAERPGYTTFDSVLDEIAHTLGYDGYATYPLDEKRREVEQLLRRQRVLVVVDNFETMTDPALLKWLLKLPEPSKVLITTREYRREYRQGAWPVELRGMSEPEALTLVTQRLRMLRLDHLAGDERQFMPLIEITGGNPKALEMALGCLKYERRSLPEVVDDLRAARGSLFEDLFHRSWALLDEAARRVLLSATLFAASVDLDALSATADVRGSAFTRALERLSDLAFFDVQQADLHHAARYTLHPLVRAFASSELTRDRAFEAAARERWLTWYLQLAAQVGYCRNDLSRLERLDPERHMLHVVVGWAQRAGRHMEVLALVNGCGFYCYVRGLMNKEPNINLAGAEAARALGNPHEEVRWLSHHVQRLARAGELAEVERYLPRIQALAAANILLGEVAEAYHHSMATYYLAQGLAERAEQEWRALLANPSLGKSSRLVTARWLATCLRQKGQLAEARELLEQSLQSAGQDANQRALISLRLMLTQVLLDQGDLEAGKRELAAVQANVVRDAVERHVPDVHMLEGRLRVLEGDVAEARQAYAEAIDGFNRLGLRRELAEARQELANLEAGAAPNSVDGRP